jgi:hypothetical protein
LELPALIDEVPCAVAAGICGWRESGAFLAFNYKRRGGREVRKINPDWGLSEVFEESWLGKGVDANGGGSPFAESCRNVGLEASRLVSIRERSKGNGSNYRDYCANNY